MDEDAVLLAIGELKGQMQGIGRELGEIKDRVGDGKNGICGRISDLEMNGARISQQNAQDIIVIKKKVEELDTRTKASDEADDTVRKIMDSNYTRFGVIMGAILGIAAFVLRLSGR